MTSLLQLKVELTCSKIADDGVYIPNDLYLYFDTFNSADVLLSELSVG